MRFDLYTLTFETPHVTFYLWSPWRAAHLEHRLFDAIRNLAGSKVEEGPDELRIQLSDPKACRSAVQAVARVLKGWQEEAERGSERIAVEITSFVADSPVRDLQEAVGQFVVYRALLSLAEPDRLLFLGVSTRVYDSVLSEPLGQLVVDEVRLRVLVFDPHQQRVVQWIN